MFDVFIDVSNLKSKHNLFFKNIFWSALKMCDSNLGLLTLVIALSTFVIVEVVAILISLLHFCIGFVGFMASFICCLQQSYRSSNYCKSNSGPSSCS